MKRCGKWSSNIVGSGGRSFFPPLLFHGAVLHHVAHLLPVVTLSVFSGGWGQNKSWLDRLKPAQSWLQCWHFASRAPTCEGKKRREGASSSAKLPLPLFSPNERAINWRGDNLEKKGTISLSACFPFTLLCNSLCQEDYTERPFLLYVIKSFMCMHATAHTHPSSLAWLMSPSYRLTEWRPCTVMLQHVSVPGGENNWMHTR